MTFFQPLKERRFAGGTNIPAFETKHIARRERTSALAAIGPGGSCGHDRAVKGFAAKSWSSRFAVGLPVGHTLPPHQCFRANGAGSYQSLEVDVLHRPFLLIIFHIMPGHVSSSPRRQLCRFSFETAAGLIKSARCKGFVPDIDPIGRSPELVHRKNRCSFGAQAHRKDNKCGRTLQMARLAATL